MPYRSNLFWKAFTAILLVAALTALVAHIVEPLGGRVLAAALAGATAAAASLAVAAWVAIPVQRLREWLASGGGDRLSLEPSDDWHAIAGRLSEWHGESRRRIAGSETELERLRTVLATMADGVLVVDADRRIGLANPAAASLLAVDPAEAVGRTVIECTLSTELDEAVGAALQGDGDRTADLELLHPQHSRIHALVRASGEAGNRAAVVVLQDRTDAMRLEAVRRDFVANVSHELRTPVTGIQTIAENLLDGALDDPQAARLFLQHILTASRRLVSLVDDLLNLARAESHPRAERTRVAVAPIARTVVAGLHPLISEKRLDIGLEVPDTMAVWAESESLRQVLSNLVDNAVKYTPDGGRVEVSAERDGGIVHLRVSDTGIGIAPEHHGRIFERFYRVDRARSRAVGGTGLGLSIVKHLVEGMGGGVYVESGPGRGATFVVTLPAPPGD